MYGIIVGCDQNQEWLLDWWWSHYSKNNSYPVVFIDFGMSQQGLAWCKDRGTVIALPATTPPVASSDRYLWEIAYNGAEALDKMRSAWFKKPLAFLAAPFEITLWLDLDCQVNGSLAPLLDSLPQETEIALCKEERLLLFSPSGITYYNTGVVLFRKGSPILYHIVKTALREQEYCLGDQEAIGIALASYPSKIAELPLIYNWDWKRGSNSQALILHYVGPKGKLAIRDSYLFSL